MNDKIITGWDIGGAHLKVAQANSQGSLQHVFQIPCPLWQGIEALHIAIKTAFEQLDPTARSGRAAITMTGELADCFPNRQAGVAAIINAFTQHFPEAHCHVFAGDPNTNKAQWLSPSQAMNNWQLIASRNWQASADFAAQHIGNALFIDIGSTTCDIIPLSHGKAIPQSFNDHQRQITRELLYTGAIRTPLIALADHAPFKGQNVGLAAEVFATTGDCWILLDKLDAQTIQDRSADGEPWTKHHAAIRLARLLGTDADVPNAPIWNALAHWFAEKQQQLIQSAINQVVAQSPNITLNTHIIGAGIGRSIIYECAQNLGVPYLDFSHLSQLSHPDAADHVPAIAVALLAAVQFK